MFIDDIDIMPVVEGLCACIVEFIVKDCTPPVLHCVFEGCDSEDYNNGNGSQTRIRCAKDGKYLHLSTSIQ